MLLSSQNAAEVGLLKGLLDDTGIACEIRNESSYPNFPGAAFQPELWILSDADYQKACEVRDALCNPHDSCGPEASRISPSLRGFYLYLGFVSLAGAIVLAWQGARSGNLATFGAGFGICGFMAGVCFVVAGQLRLPKRKKASKDS